MAPLPFPPVGSNIMGPGMLDATHDNLPYNVGGGMGDRGMSQGFNNHSAGAHLRVASAEA